MTRSRILFFSSILLFIAWHGTIFYIVINYLKTNENFIESVTKTSVRLDEQLIVEETISKESVPEEVEKTVREMPPATSTHVSVVDPEPKKPDKPEVITPEKTKNTSVSFSSSEMLAAHNALRQAVGVSSLIYSQTLAQSAQKWSDKLQKNDCSPQHDATSNYGENLFWSSRTGGENLDLLATPSTVTNAWASEIEDYNYSSNSCRPGKVCGHYTQIVWKDTTEIGCGVSLCQKGNIRSQIWVCRYNPPGNYIGENPY